ncbi:MAG TPA: prolipoprotein diacylglyceryl transferase [Vicinamibacterales bacterium]|nr:prolipoprotein diacylglyceryl transferase [Vicinamibacterales bacterium]
MHPILFEIGGFPVYTYGLLLAAAYLLGLQFALVRAKSRGLNPNRVMDLGIWIIVSALVGAKLMLLVVERDRFGWSVNDLMNLFRSAGVFYGGLIAAVTVALFYLWRHRMPVWTVTDVFAPGIALGHVIGRLGCLFAGCCFGRQTDVPWAITFHNEFAHQNVGTPLNVALHPTQLYEAGAELLILGMLLALERRGRAFPGRTFWTYMLVYGISRFVIEIYRGDSRGIVNVLGQQLSTSQFVSLLLVPLSLVMLVFLSRRYGPVTPADAATARRVRAA